MVFMFVALFVCQVWFHRVKWWLTPSSANHGRRKPITDDSSIQYRSQPKPEWVKKEIIKMKALMPHSGHRTITDTFNRRFEISKSMTVGKTFVGYTIKNHLYEIRVLRKKIKRRKPRAMPKNITWGLDLTGKTDSQGKLHNILGMIDHGTRTNLCLHGLHNKASITLLRCLLDAIEKYGKPKTIRTDNERVFTSRLFYFGLWLLNIRHQKTDKGCPWMNGRIERFFGTLKEKLNFWEIDNLNQLNNSLGQFQIWYNHIRPHQNLNGRTPAEVWQGADIYNKRSKKEYWFEAWDGLLNGYYLRL